MSGFGAGFRKAREAQGIAIDTIANETRIGVRFLRAIENEDFDILPGGLFNRGFIRAYAERLGLDPDQAVEDYQRLSRDRESPPSEAPSHRSTREGAPPWAIIAVAAAAIIAIVAYMLLSGNSAPPTKDTPAPQSEKSAAPAPAPPPETTPPPEQPAEPEPVKAPLNVEMRITETTWLQVLTDGVTADVGEFDPGTTRNYTAQKSIDVKVGNAGGLSLKVNDREISTLGKRGEVRQFTITPENASQLGN